MKLSMLFLRYFVFCKSCCNIVVYSVSILRAILVKWGVEGQYMGIFIFYHV